MKRTVSALLCVFQLCLSFPVWQASAAAEKEYFVPVFETADLHGYLVDTAFEAPSDYQFRLARIADFIEDTRGGDSSKTVVLDGGDIYSGNAIETQQTGHPVSAAYHQMQYDAVALGGHEFDRGLDASTDADGTMPDFALGELSGENTIPVLCCNLYDANDSTRVCRTKDYVMLQKTAVASDGTEMPVQIAVIGYLHNMSGSILPSRIADYYVEESLAPIDALARELKQSRGADAVILLAHRDAKTTAAALPEDTAVDLVCGADSHYAQTGVEKAAYIQPSAKARGYAYAELRFTEDGTVKVAAKSTVSVTGNTALLLDTPGNSTFLCPSVMEVSRLAVQQIHPLLSETLGTITTAITSDAIGSHSMSSTAGNWVTDLANRACNTQVSFANSGGVGAELLLKNGIHTVTAADIYNLAPYGNYLYVYSLYYNDLLEILNWAVSHTGLNLRMSGIDCYYSGTKVTALVEDGICIYKNGTWAKNYQFKRLRVSANEFVATFVSGPFSGHIAVDVSKIDNESFIDVLREEGTQNDGYLSVDNAPHMIKSSYSGALAEEVFSVTTVCSAGGTVSPTARVSAGTDYTVYFSADPGYHVTQLLIDGIERELPESNSFTFCNIQRDHTLEVVFAQDTTDPCEGYTDINRDSWYHDAADFVIERGLMGSTTTDALTFEPNTPCTRSMIVMILYNIAGTPDVTYEAKFPDVPNGQWYTKAVMWAYQNGIVSGYDNGKFGPNDKITREQMAVVLKGYADFKGIDTSKTADLSKFPDSNKATWSKTYIAWAVAEGLISGKAQNEQTYLDPQGSATRAQVAAVMKSFIENLVN